MHYYRIHIVHRQRKKTHLFEYLMSEMHLKSYLSYRLKEARSPAQMRQNVENKEQY